MIVRTLAAMAAFAALCPTAAHAQDIGPALNPTTMMGYAGTVAAGQHAQDYYAKRGYKADLTRNPQVRSICTNLDWYQKRATPAKFRRLAANCKLAGF